MNPKEYISLISAVMTIVLVFVMFYVFRNDTDPAVKNNFMNIINFIAGSAVSVIYNHIPDKDKKDKS